MALRDLLTKVRLPGGVARSLSNEVSRIGQEANRETVDGLSQMGPASGLRSSPLDETGQPRRWQFRPGYNLPTQPGEGRVSYNTLRAVADMYDIARKAIEIRKEEICSLPWDITVREPDKRKRRELLDKRSMAISRVKRRFDLPDGRNTYQTWLRQGLEDYFVLDAMCTSTMRNLGGDVIGWRFIDGATIKVRIDVTGEVPMRPGIAYQQYLFGYPRFDFFNAQDPMSYLDAVRRWRSGDGWIPDASYGTTPSAQDWQRFPPGELRYRPRNKRTFTQYGFSHVEGFLTHVNIALRWQLWEQAFWVEGNIPSSLVSVPQDWTQPQIEEYQAWWDAMMAGDPGKQRGLRFVPGGSKVFDIEPALQHSTDFAQWLATITLLIFDLNRSEVGLDPLNSEGLGGKGHAEGMAEQTMRASLRPAANWLKTEFFDPMIQQDLGYEDFEWVWPSLSQENERQQAEVNQILIQSGQRTLDEVLIEDGKEPVGVGRFMVVGNQVYFEKDLIDMTKKGALGLQAENQQQMLQHQSGLKQDEARTEAELQPKPTSPATKSAEAQCAQGCGCNIASDGQCPDPDCTCDCPTCHHDKPVPPKQAALGDLARWERKALKAVRSGKSAQVPFASEYLDAELLTVGASLGTVSSSDEVRSVFRAARARLSAEEE